jgi:uncharacterized protein (DUF2062 family)
MTVTDPTPIAGPFRPALILPTYNNATTLADVVTRCLRLSLPTYVIDDGCTDNTQEILASLPPNPNLKLLKHPLNQGKAAAIRTGFKAAMADGCTHGATVDTDGQLAPEEVPDLLAAAEKNPIALILGVRNFDIAGYPPRSQMGRRIANLFIYIESGAKVHDSQCGFRVYPLDLCATVTVRSGRYGYETEIITRAAWAHCAIVEVPVTCQYFIKNELRVTHYKPWIDTFRAIGLHGRLILRSLAPWPHKRWPRGSKDPVPWWRRFLHWVNPMELWHQARLERKAGPLGAAIGVGVFVGNLPTPGLHPFICLYAARKLRLHPLGVLAGSLVALPPWGLILVALNIGVGSRLLDGQWPKSFREIEDDYDRFGLWKFVGHYFREWATGGVVIGVIMGLIAFALVVALVHLLPRKKGTLADNAKDQARAASGSSPVLPSRSLGAGE